MNIPAMTSRDCYEAARRKTEIITCQRKLNRLLGAISEKELYAARYKSRLICALYDSEIEALYAEVAALEGHVMANELELEQIEAKRREVETQRLVRLFQLTAPTLEPAVPTPPKAPARTEQLAMFGPGPAPIDTKPVGNRSAADREWAVENDIALGMELANEAREEGKSESALAVIAAAASPAVAPQTAPTAESSAQPEPQPEPQPFRFAYTFDPPTAAQSPATQRPATQRPAAQTVPAAASPTQAQQVVTTGREGRSDRTNWDSEHTHTGGSR